MPVPEGSIAGELTDSARDGLTDLLEAAALKGLEDAFRIATELPQFIADDDFIAPGALPTRLIGRAACDAWARGGGPDNNPEFDGFWGGLCGPYLGPLGAEPTPGSIGPAFTGGQCPGVQYRIAFSFNGNTGSRETVELIEPGIFLGTFTRPGANGSTETGYTRQTPGQPAVQSRVATVNQGISPAPSLQILFRLDGQPDNCGNPPPLYDPPKIRPGLPELPPTRPINFPGFGDLPVSITFSPEGTLVVGLPDVGVEVDIEDPFGFGGGDDDGGGGAPPAGPPPGDVGDPGSPVGVGPGGEEEGEAPPGSVLTGLRVQIVAFPGSRNKYTEDVYRGAYYAYMGVPGLLDLDFGGSMVRTDQFLLAEKDNLTAWRIRANTGYELITTPYYREVE